MHHASDPFGIVGQILDGQFRVDQLVGEGGFSAVYRGHHLGLAEPIAIKCLKLPPTLTPPLIEQFVTKFRDESRILYRLSQGNLNIVRSIASGSWVDPKIGIVVPYMVLEWLEGRSVANDFTVRRTTGHVGRPLDEIVRVFAGAADGLAYAHSQGVIHRDLNPGNLFLVNTPQGQKMKVLDFGVAKLMHDSALNLGPRAQTIGAIRIFAPAYGAPEQFDDTIGPVGAQTDVHAFALILLEALRDRCVNEGTHLGEFATRATDPNNRPTPRGLGIDVSDDIESVFARATMLNPRERWATAGDFWKAITASASSPVIPGKLKSTVQGMGPVQKTSGTARLDKTMPLGSPALPPNLGGVAPPKPDPAKIPAPRPAAGTPAVPPRTPLPPRPPSSPSHTPVPPPPARPAAGRSATAGAIGQPTSKPRTPTTMGLPPPARRPSERNVPAMTQPLGTPAAEAKAAQKPMPSEPPELDKQEEVVTKIGEPSSAKIVAGSLDGGWDPGEEEDEVTRVRAPDDDVLRELAEQQQKARESIANQPAANQTGQTVAYNPSPVPPDPPSDGTLIQEAPPVMTGREMPAGMPPLPEPTPPSLGGTLMMQPGMQLPQLPNLPNPPPPFDPSHVPPPSLGQQAPFTQQPQTAPNAFPSMQQQGPLGSTLAHPGAPYPQQPQQNQPPQQTTTAPTQSPLRQTTPQQMQPQQPGQQPFMPSPYAGRSGDSFSMPPRSQPVPQQAAGPNNKMLFIIGGVAGLFLLFGVIGLTVFFVRRPSSTTTLPSATASIASSAPVAVEPPPPPVDPTPPAATEEVDAGSAPEVEDDADAGAATPMPTATTTTTAPVATTTMTANPTPPPEPQPTNTAVATKDAGAPAAPVDPNAWNEAAARGKLAQANGVLAFCKKEGGVTGPGTASVTFGTDGTVTGVALDPPYAGTKEGECVAGQFKRQKTNAFQGSPQTIKHSFEVPK